jgi:putative OPT family oligopeptide transporter
MAEKPFISSAKSLPELTIKAVFLSILLSIILSASNAYLGLTVGMTVSASIPAAVLSMAILKLFKNSNILENNIVQTSASAGEALAAGAIFTFPALIILGTWESFNYLQTTLVTVTGGLLGVMFSIPLRRIFIIEQPLKFPEGIATAAILKSGESNDSGAKYLLISALLGGVYKLAISGLQLFPSAISKAFTLGKSHFHFSMSLSPAMSAVGFILGLNIALVIFIGSALNWWVIIPLHPYFSHEIYDSATSLWQEKTRFIGVGAMLVGGLWALISIRKNLSAAIKFGIESFTNKEVIIAKRTEKDIAMKYVLVTSVFALIPLFIIFLYFSHNPFLAFVMALFTIIAGFLFSAVAAYMAGMVGSSHNPISGVTIATILIASLIILSLTGNANPTAQAALAILIGAVICCAAAISGDNMQDLKAGHILGATPYKQQIIQIVGVIAASLVIAPILSLLLNAYGIGAVTSSHPQALPAPQAMLMASVAQGVFNHDLPWNMVIIGAIIAIIVIIIDQILEKKNSEFRMPVLAVALGIYIPLSLTTPILLGGFVAYLIKRKYGKKHDLKNGILFSAGLITGEALLGIFIAIPIAITGDKNILAIATANLPYIATISLLLIVFAHYKVAKK